MWKQENKRYRRHLERTVRRQTRQIRQTFLSAIDSLVRTMEERDPYTAGHSVRVRRYSLALAGALDLNQKQRKLLSLAAKLHDIGKIGVPEAILNKPGSLTGEEMAAVRLHPEIGERVLRPIIRRPEILAAIRGHHERPDGGGYPDGLRGSAIPMLARIITIADCFDALTTSRAYRNALSLPQAVDVLRKGSGTQFEPAFLDAFLQVIPRLHVPEHASAADRVV